jgi:asparagine synthase (glutamine-hydrolysing)
MCGFAGVLRAGDVAAPGAGTLAARAGAMASALAHRGPDDADDWADDEAGIALSFRRLSILDLSEQGRQPMPSHCGRYVIAYNGEIYNHRELRGELGDDLPWRGHSDTEVLLAAIARFGVVPALERLNGMFAFALWDRTQRELWLARDRFGEKPLYVGQAGEDLVFASELRALSRHPRFRGEPDAEALTLFLRYGYVPGPLTAYREVRKLLPGHVLRVRGDGQELVSTPYWDPVERARCCAEAPFTGGMPEAREALTALIDDATARRTIADVPLGAFLSGGIDSSTVVAAMAHAGSEVRTFSIGFEDPRFDESPYAAAVASHLGTRHRSITVSAGDCLAVVDRLHRIYDEPFADASQIPTVLLCQLTRAHVTVSLSGDGGDELFGGYPRYRDTPPRWARIAALPAPLRAGSRLAWRALASHPGRLARKLRRGLRDPGVGDRQALFRNRMSHWLPGEALRDTPAESLSMTTRARTGSIADAALAFMVFDAVTYLPDDLQVKMDRASMGVSLEVRAPLLDHRLAEFAWRLPPALSVQAPGKRLLREVLYQRVPRSLLERPKRGFEPPIGDWLRGPLRERAEHYFAPATLARHGLIDPRHVAQRWQEHLAGRNRAHALWTVFMLGAWLDATSQAGEV